MLGSFWPDVALILYSISLIAVVYIAFKSDNDIATVFGLIYGIYSLGFLQRSFEYKYFTETVNVTFGVLDYLRLFLLNCLVLLVLVLGGGRVSRRPINPLHNRLIGLAFCGLGIVGMLNELRFYGLSDFLFSDKTLRFSGDLGSVNNLFIISIDYHIFIIAGVYALIVASRSSWWRAFFIGVIAAVAAVGFVQGYRYYLAAIFLFVFLSVAKRRLKANVIVVAFFVVTGLFLAEFSKIFLSWLKYYEWVSDSGFVNFFALNYTGIVPNEVQAIATNTFLGFHVYARQLHPDVVGYFVKAIPFSERFYDFSSFDQLYSALGQDLGLRIGEGTAFSFFLDNYLSYFLPLVVVFSVLWLTKIHPAPIVKIIALFFLLNIVRNGFLVSISVLKIPLLIYGLLYVTVSILLWAGRLATSGIVKRERPTRAVHAQ